MHLLLENAGKILLVEVEMFLAPSWGSAGRYFLPSPQHRHVRVWNEVEVNQQPSYGLPGRLQHLDSVGCGVRVEIHHR